MLIDSSRIIAITDDADEVEVEYYVSNRRDNTTEVVVHRVQVWVPEMDQWKDVTLNYSASIQERINKMIAKDMISNKVFEATV